VTVSSLIVVLALGALVAVRLHAAAPVAVVTAIMPTDVYVPAPKVLLPWPATGQAAIAVP
jgi:hypothetical protein